MCASFGIQRTAFSPCNETSGIYYHFMYLICSRMWIKFVHHKSQFTAGERMWGMKAAHLLLSVHADFMQVNSDLGIPTFLVLWAKRKQEDATMVFWVVKKYRSCLLLSSGHAWLLPCCFLIVAWWTSEKNNCCLVHLFTLWFCRFLLFLLFHTVLQIIKKCHLLMKNVPSFLTVYSYI